jgi:D-serine deaminase-like pyridoxal phosphate-dependent protein
MPKGITRRSFFTTAAAGAAAMSIAPTIANAETWKRPIEPLILDKPLSLEDVPTPALVLDLDRMESNLKRMTEHSKNTNTGLRPHSKTHKCPIIAQKQIELGAVGICCAKVSEAEVMSGAGIKNILITSPVTTRDKISRVIGVAQSTPGLQMVVDNEKTAKDFNDAAKAAGIELNVLIDLDVGTRRTGIRADDGAVDFAKSVSRLKNLKLDGYQAYAGHVMHIKGHDSRSKMSIASMKRGLDVKKATEKAGIEMPIYTGGGTGTFDIDAGTNDITDLQVGSYLFMDVEYRAVGDKDSEVFDFFDPSLYVLVTTISQPSPRGGITVDAGFKSFASENVKPEVADVEGVGYQWFGDEHGMLLTKNASRKIKLGEKLKLIISHCDPTVNLYDYYYVLQDGKVRELWPIAARGMSQ